MFSNADGPNRTPCTFTRLARYRVWRGIEPCLKQSLSMMALRGQSDVQNFGCKQRRLDRVKVKPKQKVVPVLHLGILFNLQLCGSSACGDWCTSADTFAMQQKTPTSCEIGCTRKRKTIVQHELTTSVEAVPSTTNIKLPVDNSRCKYTGGSHVHIRVCT